MGAIVTQIATGLRHRRDLAIKVADSFLDLHDDFAHVRMLLRDPASLAGDRKAVLKVANRLEVIATYYLGGFCDAGIAQAFGLPESCRKFYQEMGAAQQLNAAGVAESAFPAAEMRQRLPHLYRLSQAEEPS